MEADNSHPTFVTGGTEVITDSFTWTVENFSNVDVIAGGEFQDIVFEAWKKENVEWASRWEFKLSKSSHGPEKYLNFLVKSLELPEAHKLHSASIQFRCQIKKKNGSEWVKGSGLKKMTALPQDYMEICSIYMPLDDAYLDKDGHLTMHWTMKVFRLKCRSKGTVTSVKPCCTKSVAHFESEAKAKLARDMLEYVDGAGPVHTVTLRAMDGAEFTAAKFVLAARSPVFEAMFRPDMKEGITGKVHIADLSGQTLDTLLNFICKGELFPEWNRNDAILNLAYAAHKYQITDLLDFLDIHLAGTCDLENAGEFLSAARKLSLVTAERNILKFLRDNVGNSVEELERFVNCFRLEEVSENNENETVGKSECDEMKAEASSET